MVVDEPDLQSFMDKLLYTVEEVITLTGLGKSKLYDVMRDGTLLSVKIGASRRIPAEALNQFVADLIAGAR